MMPNPSKVFPHFDDTYNCSSPNWQATPHNSKQISPSLGSAFCLTSPSIQNFNAYPSFQHEDEDLESLQTHAWNSCKRSHSESSVDIQESNKKQSTYSFFDFSSQSKKLISVKRNERERNRVKLINQGFTLLREHVPVCRKHKKTSKVDTLKAAVDYIEQLQKILHSQEGKEVGRVSFGKSGKLQTTALTQSESIALKNNINIINQLKNGKRREGTGAITSFTPSFSLNSSANSTNTAKNSSSFDFEDSKFEDMLSFF